MHWYPHLLHYSPSTSGSFNYVRCLRSSLGSSPRICMNSGFLEKLSVFLAHKQKGVKSSLSGIKILNPKSNKCSCSNLHRQQNSSCLYKPFRGHKISGIEFHCSKNVGVVSGEEHVPFGSICTRDIEQNCRFVILPETKINRMDVKSQNFQTNSKCLQNASSRHVRIRPKSPSSKVFLSDSGSTSCGNRRILSKLEQRSPLHVSSLQSDSKISSENNRRQGNRSFNNTSLAVKTMVSNATESPIPHNPQILKLPWSQTVHPLFQNRKFRLAVWPLSGDLLKTKNFQKGCAKYCRPHGNLVQKNSIRVLGNNSLAGVHKGHVIRLLAL